MCLFFNSIKKPTSKIPFLFFLTWAFSLLSLTKLGASASCLCVLAPRTQDGPLSLHAS